MLLNMKSKPIICDSCIGGNLFDDIERYETLDEVENRIKKLLL